MKHAITFSTSNGNLFLYSPFRNQFLLCHPLIRYFHQFDPKDSDFRNFQKKLSGKKSLSIPPYGEFPVSEIKYQLRKYRMLKKYDFFKPVSASNLRGKLYPDLIRENLGKVRQIIFETTESCNLSCTYCTYSKFYINKKRGDRDFTFQDAQQMLEFFLSQRQTQAGQELTISFYGGEPLQNFKFIRDVVLFLVPYKNKGQRFRFTMSTNGLLLSKYIDFLAEHSFDAAISLDGDEAGNSFRRLKNNQESFKLVTANLDKVKMTHPDYFRDHISFLTVLHNKNSYPQVYRFFNNKYGKIPLMSTINTLNINQEYKMEFEKTFLKRDEQDQTDAETLHSLFMDHPRVRSVADMVEKYSGYFFKNASQFTALKPGRPSKKKFIPTATCLPFALRVFFSADGSILPCEHIPRIFELGKFAGDNIQIDCDQISREFNERYEKIRSLCEKCFIHDNCKECIFNTRIETDQPECEYFTDEAKFIRQHAYHISQIESDFPLYLKILKEGLHV